jgi:hypothetical protein
MSAVTIIYFFIVTYVNEKRNEQEQFAWRRWRERDGNEIASIEAEYEKLREKKAKEHNQNR